MTKYGPVGAFTIANKIVLVTGGGSGIGLAFVQLCHNLGARVLIGDLKLTSEAQSYLQSIPNKSEVIFHETDVSSWSALHDLVSTSIRHFDSVPDIYAPVAGVFEPPWSNFWDDTEDDSYKTLQINVAHPIKLTRLAMRALASADKKGVVCLVSSTAGIRGNYLASLYTASKHAIVGFTKAMALADPEEGVKIVCVLPGMVDTPLWTDRTDDVAERSRFKDRPAMTGTDIAECMIRMVESEDVSGGAVVLKTKAEEQVVEAGWDQRKKEDDPSPRPEADLSRIKEVLQRERGKAWEV